jgi:hypothetical protein
VATDPVDPIEEEVAHVLADPEVRARIDAFEEREKQGKLRRRSHNEARRIVGQPPLPQHD